MSQVNLNSAIAIIAISGRFPGAKDIDSFWQNLRDGVESISGFTDQELLDSGVDYDLLKNNNYVRAKGILPDIDLFDANFFGYSALEAEIIDPQQRLFLECAWSALEKAGYNPETYEGLIGVYAGVGMNRYLLNNIYPNRNFVETVDPFQLAISSDKDFLPTRVAYKLNLTGPAVNVQTACSTSLVAVHLACQSLLNGECDMALAGGVSVDVPQVGYLYQDEMILSPDGHCRAFDAKAQGTVGGSGVGIVVLKRLQDAIAHRDYIHAIVKGSAINNDGSLKVGYTAPSVDGQAAVITEAQAVASIDAETISYVEAHGTGTPLGDPIEIAALTQAFTQTTQKKGFCAIGSVKTNVGHLDTAAGVTGLIKTVLALQNKLLPPSLHFQTPNPKIDFADSPFYVNSTLTEWKTNGTPRRAGVSSFGIGGTNAHVILESAPVINRGQSGKKYHLLILSAKTNSALETATVHLADHLQQHPELNIADVAYTLGVGRKAFNHCRIVVCQDLEDAVKALRSLEPKQVFTNYTEVANRSVVFMFPGQGSQYVNLTREIYQTESVFREQVDLCSEIIKPILGLDLRQIIYPREEKTDEAANQLQQTAIAQAAIFVIEYALAKLWQSWGVQPVAAMGHGIGEYVAACLAGVFSLEDALSLVAERVKQVSLNPPKIPYISNLTGTWITAAQATNPEYYTQHLRSTVLVAQGVEKLLATPEQILLEVGLGRTLTTLAQRHPDKTTEPQVFNSLPDPQEERSHLACLYTTLGQLWLTGVKVDWSGFYSQEHYRLPLPTYPFERQRYWIEPPRKDDCESQLTLTKKPDIADWFYIPSWKRSPVSQLGEVQGSILLFINDCNLGTQLVKQLQQHNQKVIVVQVGKSFKKENDIYTLNPRQPKDYEILLLELGESIPRTILHLWSLELEGIDQALDLGFYSLLFLAQAFGKQNFTDEVQLIVVSNNMLDVTGEEELRPEQATLIGPVLTIPKEYPYLSCRSVDVVIPQQGTLQEKQLLEQLQTECQIKSSDQIIAYRQQHRWVQTFESVKLNNSNGGRQRLKEGGVYLITGGLGGIGLTLAKYLAQKVKAQLILTGRSAFPDRINWEKWLNSHHVEDSTSQKIRKVYELEKLGSEVLVVSADVTNLTQMQQAIAQCGKIDGVIHAAGVPGGGLIQQKTREQAESVMDSKVKGAIVLDTIFSDRQLDFFVLLSSLNSTIPALGQVDYCAANTFLDAFAHRNNSRNSTFTVTINWDGWQEVGMAAEAAKKFADQLNYDFLQQTLSPTEGIEAFSRILHNQLPQVLVSTLDFTARLNQVRELVKQELTSPPTHLRPQLNNSYVAPRNGVEQKIADIWQEYLGLKQVGIYDNFLDLGGDSLIAIQIISRLRNMFGIKLAVASLFESPTIAEIVANLEEQQTAQSTRSNSSEREEIEI